MNEETIRTLKVETCPSLSGQSTLTYHVGCDTEEVVHISLQENTGGGFFSKEWVALHDILGSKPVTASVLRSLIYQGKSANSGGFLLAVLVAEGLLKLTDEKLRTYEPADSAAYEKKIQALMENEPSPVKRSKKPQPAGDNG